MVGLQRFGLKIRLLGFQDTPDSAPMVPRPSEPKLGGSGPGPGPGPGPEIFIHRLGLFCMWLFWDVWGSPGWGRRYRRTRKLSPLTGGGPPDPPNGAKGATSEIPSSF